MGNSNIKSTFRNAIVFLNISAQEISLSDDKFWSQIWTEDPSVAADIIKAVSLQEIRMLRDGSPKNFASLTYKMVELLYRTTGTLCNTHSQQAAVIIATRIITRIVPCIFEDDHWKNFFFKNKISKETYQVELKYPNKQPKERNYEAYLPNLNNLDTKSLNNRPTSSIPPTESDHFPTEALTDCESKLLNLVDFDTDSKTNDVESNIPHSEEEQIDKDSLFEILILSVCDLLFCPEFTVLPRNDNYLISNSIDTPPVDLKSLPSCEYVWEPGVGFDSKSNSTTYYDKSRIVLLRLLLTIQSETLYVLPEECKNHRNLWIETIVSSKNRHVLAIFTTLLNTVFIHNPTKLNPINRLLFEDNRTEVVELCVQILIATLDYQPEARVKICKDDEDDGEDNLFIEYLSRIHRSEDFDFIIKGFKRLLNTCLEQNYLISSPKIVSFHQELLLLFWKLSNMNEKFVSHLLKSNIVLEITVPILYHLNENFQDTGKSALIHLGVFNLLILSGERNFGVKLNKPYSANALVNLPTFTGSHADLLIIVFHKLILYGYGLNQLFDYMITILVNISPYLKALTTLACKCLIQLFEIFSSPMVIFTELKYHNLVIFLLEIFNNIVQYQFDGNANLVYIILKHKEAFLNLASIPCTKHYIDKIFNKLIKKKKRIMMIGCRENDEGDNSGRGIHDRNEINSEQILLATVSNDSPDSPHHSQNSRGVSLTPTPNISRVTQMMRQFYGPHSRNEDSNNQPSISFDDILNDETGTLKSPKSRTDDSLMTVFSNTDDNSNQLILANQNPSTSNPPNQRECEDKWKPTPEWIRNWKQTLPIQTILRMIEVLVPQIEHLKEEGLQQDEIETMKFLQNGTLVGLLPVPHPIIIRKYKTNNAAKIWFKTCTWAIIYIRQDVWTDTAIKLIKIV